MKTASLRLRIIMLLVVLFLLMMAVVACSSVPKYSPIQSEVTKRDSRGRVQVLETRASDGVCMAEVVYEHGMPTIHVLVISRIRLQNLGYRLVLDGTEEGISDAVLMRNIDEVVREQCLPFIIRGYREA